MENIINDIIANRRSVYPKFYTDEPIEDAIIEQMLKNANWAPTHRLTQPWRFTVFTGDGIKKFAEHQAERYRSTNQNTFDQNQYDKLRNKPLSASHIIAVGLKKDPKQRVPLTEEICAVACAVQNMLLTASSYQLGAYWSTGGTTNDKESNSFYNLSLDDLQLGFLYIGHCKQGVQLKSSRTPIENKIQWIK